MSKHTKGPWKVLKYESGQFSVTAEALQSDMPVCLVAKMKADEREHANQEANANLISAAPELLHACHHLLTELEAHDIHAPVRIALAKKAIAEGEAEGE